MENKLNIYQEESELVDFGVFKWIEQICMHYDKKGNSVYVEWKTSFVWCDTYVI